MVIIVAVAHSAVSLMKPLFTARVRWEQSFSSRCCLRGRVRNSRPKNARTRETILSIGQLNLISRCGLRRSWDSRGNERETAEREREREYKIQNIQQTRRLPKDVAVRCPSESNAPRSREGSVVVAVIIILECYRQYTDIILYIISLKASNPAHFLRRIGLRTHFRYERKIEI